MTLLLDTFRHMIIEVYAGCEDFKENAPSYRFGRILINVTDPEEGKEEKEFRRRDAESQQEQHRRVLKACRNAAFTAI